MAVALLIWLWPPPEHREIKTTETPSPPATVGADCSNERINHLARVDPERMSAEFRTCIEQLARRMGK